VAPPDLSAQLTPAERERLRQEQEVHREIQREWREEEWRRHNERFFGPGVVIERYPGEAYDQYVVRIHARCELRWRDCSTACNTILDPLLRSSCLANCNTDLHECNAGY
jgi:hypothetical protein